LSTPGLDDWPHQWPEGGPARLLEALVGAPWPMLAASTDADADAEASSVERVMAHLAAFQVHSFVDVHVTPDERNASQYVLQFFKGEPLVDREWFAAGAAGRRRRYLRTYRDLIEETVLLLSGGRRDALAQVDQLIEFEARFAEVGPTATPLTSSCSLETAT